MAAAAAKRAKGKPVAPEPNTNEARAPEKPEPDEYGLWVNTAFFRRVAKRPEALLHPATQEEENYFLKLADIALGNVKEKCTADRRINASQESRSQFRKKK
jgi:hypothetical protein